MRKISRILCAAMTVIVATPALAQETTTDTGPYFSLAVGGSDGSFVDHSYTQSTPSLGSSEDFESDYSLTGMAALGYQWMPSDSPGGFRMELEGSYRHTPIIYYTNTLGTEGTADGYLETVGIMANAYVDLNIGEFLTPYFGAGLGAARAARRDLTIAGVPFTGKFSYSTAWQVMTGIGYKLSPGTIIGVDFRHFEVQEFGWPDAPSTNVHLEFNEILLTVRLVG